MNTTEIYLIAMALVFTLPYLIWRLGNTHYFAPLVVVQIITGILLGPGILGNDWIGPNASAWQFVMGVAMSSAVTALPILILLMEQFKILRLPIGQRILRYASLDDIAIWGVLALILMDWTRVGKQAIFLLAFAVLSYGLRQLIQRVPSQDRWYFALMWLIVCAFGADWCGLHFMVGAFLAGPVIESKWFDQTKMDMMWHHVDNASGNAAA
jgi:hypothetical protein